MIRVRVDVHPHNGSGQRALDVVITNAGPTSVAEERDPQGERAYRWAAGGARGEVRHRRIDGIGMLLTLVFADVARAMRERPRKQEHAER